MTDPNPLTPTPEDPTGEDERIGRAEDDTSDSDETVIGDATAEADAEADDAMPTERIDPAAFPPDARTEMHTLGAVGINLDDLKAPTGKTDKPATGVQPPRRPVTDKPATGAQPPRRPVTDKPGTGPQALRRPSTDKPATGPAPVRRPSTDKPATSPGPTRTSPSTDPVTPLALSSREAYSPLPGEAAEEPLAKPHSFRPIEKSDAVGASDSQMEESQGVQPAKKASLLVGLVVGAMAFVSLFLVPRPLPFHARIEVAPAAPLGDPPLQLTGDPRTYPFYVSAAAEKPAEIQIVDARADKPRAFASFSTTRASAENPAWLLRSSVSRIDEGTSPSLASLGFGLSLLAWTESGSDVYWHSTVPGANAQTGSQRFPGLQVDPKWRPVLAEDWREPRFEKLVIPVYDLARPAESKLVLVDPAAGGSYSAWDCGGTLLAQPIAFFAPGAGEAEGVSGVLAILGTGAGGSASVAARLARLAPDGSQLAALGEPIDLGRAWVADPRTGPVAMKRIRLGAGGGKAAVGWLLASTRGYALLALDASGAAPALTLAVSGTFETDGTSAGKELAVAAFADPAAPERDVALVCLADGMTVEIRASDSDPKTYAARNWARKAAPRPVGAIALDVNADGVQDLLALSAEGVWSILAGPGGAERQDLGAPAAPGADAFIGPVAWVRRGETLLALARDAKGAPVSLSVKLPEVRVKGDAAEALGALAQELHWREDRTSLFRPEVAGSK